jgi:hypothetical protein
MVYGDAQAVLVKRIEAVRGLDRKSWPHRKKTEEQS